MIIKHPKRSKQLGASLVEYALLVALIALMCVPAISSVGTAANEQFGEIGRNLGGIMPHGT